MRQVMICLIGVLLLVSGPSYAVGSEDPPSVKEFKERVKQYVDLHKKVDRAVPTVDKTSNADLLVFDKDRFAQAVQAARPNAAQGDIFSPSIQLMFKQTLKRALAGAEGKKARAIILGEGNPRDKEPGEGPTVKLTLKANTIYPTGAPLSTVPPSVLKALPVLPEELEYRFVGRHLVLRDVKAGLIVDFMTDAIPAK